KTIISPFLSFLRNLKHTKFAGFLGDAETLEDSDTNSMALLSYFTSNRDRENVRSRKMNNDDDDYKDAATGTPLSTIAQAFEEISDLIKKGNDKGISVDLYLKPFCEACSLVSVLFGCLGIAFKFAEMEYTAKVRDLLDASKHFGTLSSVVDFDLQNNTVKSPGSHTRNLRRVRQGLDLIRELFQNFLSAENHSLKKAATTAYQQVCAPYHTWAVRTAVSAGMYKSAEKEMRRYIKASLAVIENIDTLYISRGIKLDW
ncbi:Glycolipid transfer protein domain-containing protein, partial [Cynara cardunculus var. scolymus]